MLHWVRTPYPLRVLIKVAGTCGSCLILGPRTDQAKSLGSNLSGYIDGYNMKQVTRGDYQECRAFLILIKVNQRGHHMPLSDPRNGHLGWWNILTRLILDCLRETFEHRKPQAFLIGTYRDISFVGRIVWASWQNGLGSRHFEKTCQGREFVRDIWDTLMPWYVLCRYQIDNQSQWACSKIFSASFAVLHEGSPFI